MRLAGHVLTFLAVVLLVVIALGAVALVRSVEVGYDEGWVSFGIDLYPCLVSALIVLAAGLSLAVLIANLPVEPRAKLVSTPLRAERMESGRRKLLRDFEVEVDREPFRIPEGTETDYSSIPWFARALVRWSRVDIAGVVHDRLYDDGEMSRRKADRVWRLVAMAGAHRANPLQAWLGWLGLRLGGWWAWWQHRRRDEEQ